ncbi:MAG: sugar ABC transporter permease [Firmicutes bacterium]|nr:sugar ABC transporter permease [Bacillota bacterium]
MVSSRFSKVVNLILFLLPALLLYSLFFIKPFIEGVQYSFTDWNGIVPEIPLNMEKARFEQEVLAKLKDPRSARYLQRYYVLDRSGQYYNLQSWVQEGGKTRQLTNGERQKIKGILKSVGISSIKFIGFQNFVDMFKNDTRFMPRFEKRFLFNEFADLPSTLGPATFRRDLLPHLTHKDEKAFVQWAYAYSSDRGAYVLRGGLSDTAAQRLKGILARNMYTNEFIPGVIGFTLFYTFMNVLLSNFFALLLAVILDMKLRTRNLLRSIFFLPNVLSMIIVAFIWSFVFRLIFPALTGIPVWLGSPDLAPWAVVMVSVWQGAGYLMIIYLAGLQTVPTDVLEGAEVDGASPWQRLVHVKLPLLLPAFTICLFYSLANSLKTFDVIYALTGGGPGYATTPVVIDIYNNAFMQNQFGYATAKAVFLCLIIMVITGTQLWLMKRREVEL